ncbi:hypothetical protein C8P63_11665 [Melghirimyces profundicolus]|uniref:Uncharacterized protein n=1 Tax=Melghirimyces profundicolus TaxID=1242148 RepID=A0A2T6BQX5_9BACL|nr:hypothetical protein [Melghirimyces profundicolus]PTX58478.1 hypothetical protein C8P63_11665 [Melghirimyces profundicolus]
MDQGRECAGFRRYHPRHSPPLPSDLFSRGVEGDRNPLCVGTGGAVTTEQPKKAVFSQIRLLVLWGTNLPGAGRRIYN